MVGYSLFQHFFISKNIHAQYLHGKLHEGIILFDRQSRVWVPKMEFAAKVPTVTKCCCYFELRTGGLVLGWFNVVWYGLAVLGGLLSLITKTPTEEKETFLEKISVLNSTGSTIVVEEQKVKEFTVVGTVNESQNLCIIFYVEYN